jgi:hypothetical protein
MYAYGLKRTSVHHAKAYKKYIGVSCLDEILERLIYLIHKLYPVYSIIIVKEAYMEHL